MIKHFLIERRSWIFLFFIQQLLFLFIAYLDPSIPLSSILYMVFISIVIFAGFLVIRFLKEIKFYLNLQHWDSTLDLTNISDANTPFEKIIVHHITSQTEQLKDIASKNQLKLNQEKDDLLAWIHEVKTPLTAMHLMIERLESGSLKSQLSFEWLRIHLLLDQQLHQKRVSFIENDLYIERVDLKQIVFKEIKALQSWCIQKGIGFNIQLQHTAVLSDEKWLSFILRQILTNAIKYSEASDITFKSSEKDERTVLEITDYGRGIDPKDLPRIFEKGFTSTKYHQDSSSTGMGLYLTKRAAKYLHIHIEVTSYVNKGTTFTLILPKKNEFVDILSM